MTPISSYVVIAGAALCAGGFYQAFVGNFPVFGGCIAFAGGCSFCSGYLVK